eukprot:CAMPEP_0172477104 /NCGR_PEP_ID=MMETSP1065-20121228/70646_1 /TAXON_ID=265537 /ORGANISM="Amphiprora paludosa, Strain CCMP125" /LENGTH=128 /DNA_ID=CAMNT_0013235343 /DNA_START=659 /DNA_END=1045 /DNA_ORIENTATION=+
MKLLNSLLGLSLGVMTNPVVIAEQQEEEVRYSVFEDASWAIPSDHLPDRWGNNKPKVTSTTLGKSAFHRLPKPRNCARVGSHCTQPLAAVRNGTDLDFPKVKASPRSVVIIGSRPLGIAIDTQHNNPK